MRREIITTAAVPSSPVYSQAIKIGNVVLLSGIVGVDPRTGNAGATIEEQTDQAIGNCAAILEAAGASLGDVVRVLVLLKESRDFEAMNRVYARHFSKDPPTRAVARFGVEVANLLVSLVMTAWVGDAREGSAVELLTSG